MSTSTTNLGISTTTTLYGWDTLFYGPNSCLVQPRSSYQLSLYASPYWYERLTGNDKNNTLHVGGYYTSSSYSVGSGLTALNLTPFTANLINGGKGTDWISFASFTDLANAPTIGYASRYNPADPKQADRATRGNDYRDLGATTDPADPDFRQTSLIAGDGQALPVFGTPGVVVNLSGVALDAALAPLLRVDDPVSGTVQSYGLVSGLSDYLTARLVEAGARNGQNGNKLFGAGGLATGQYAFLARDGSRNYAIGQVLNVENVRGSSEASNVIVGGAIRSVFQGGSKADVIVDGSGSTITYGMGGNDLLIATSGSDTLYAGQFRAWEYTPAQAYVTDPYLLSLYNSADPADRELLGSLTGTTFVGGVSKATLVGSDAGNDYFLVGSYDQTVWGSGLGAEAEWDWYLDGDDDDDDVDIDDHDTLSFAQIGMRYYKGFRDLTITIEYDDIGHQTGEAYGTYRRADGRIVQLFEHYFYDIEHIVFGNTKMVFKDPCGVFYPERIDSGYSGGDPAQYNTSSGLMNPGPATNTVTGNNPSGGNIINAGGGGNTDFDGGAGSNNTLDFSSGNGKLYYDCADQEGEKGDIRNYSLVIDLGNKRYSYQQTIDGNFLVSGGSVANIQKILGTFDCNDIIAGKGDTLELTGGGGAHNILFGGGGGTGGVGTRLKASRNTPAASAPARSLPSIWPSTPLPGTMPNGGDGYHWAVFQNPVDLINGGVNYNNGTTSFAGTNVGGGRPNDVYGSVGIDADLVIDSYTDRATGRVGEMVGFANILGTAGIDKLIGNGNTNILVGADGNDSIVAGGGDNDVLYGGAGTNELIGVGFDVAELALDEETFVVGYHFNPVAAGAYATDGNYGVTLPAVSTDQNRDGEVSATIPGGTIEVGVVSLPNSRAKDDVWGWNTGEAAGDMLYVSNKGKAIIRGFEGDAGYTLDFRQAQNLGQIDVTLGNGNNRVFGSSSLTGVLDDNDVLDVNAVGRDRILTGDGHDSITSGNGDDLLATGAGNDHISVGWGKNQIYPGGGVNTIALRSGSGSAGDNDIYINQFNTRDDISGFVSGIDKIHLDADMLAAYGINPIGRSFVYDINLYSDDEPRGGQAFGVGRVEKPNGFSFTGEVYRAAYNSVLYSTGSSLPGWVGLDNGAFTNQDHLKGYIGGVLAGSGLTYGVYGLGIGLSFIPFVGPIIAAPVLAIAGIMAYEMSPAGGTQQHINPIYQNLDRNLLGTDFKTVQAVIPADWTQTSFTSFYNAPNDGFKPSLEAVGNGDGIATVAMLHTSDSTYLYLVNSSDNLIQNDETLLLARVNGFVSASDLALFDSDDPQHAPYAGGSSTTIIKPAVAQLSFTATAPAQVVVSPDTVTNALTNTTTPTAVVSFDSALVVGDTVTLRLSRSDGSTQEFVRVVVVSPSAPDEIAAGDLSTEFGLTLDSGETASVSVTVENAAGFTSESAGYILTVDSLAPTLSVDALGEGVLFSSNENATLKLYAGATPATLDGSATSYALEAINAFSALGTAGPNPGAPLWIDHYGVEDALGNAATLSAGADDLDTDPANPVIGLPQIGLGNASANTLNAVSTGNGDWNAALYGLAGNDTLSGGTGSNRFYGGDGDDRIVVASSSDANLIRGDAGGDTVDLSASHDSAVVLVGAAAGAASSDSYAGQTALVDDFDTIMSFSSDTDRLTLVLTDLADFVSADDAKIRNPVLPETGTKIVEVDVDADGTFGEAGDIYLRFVSGQPTAATIAYNLTARDDGASHVLSSGAGDDVIVGSRNDDTLTGGQGRDVLGAGPEDSITGLDGNDTFVFSKGDSASTPAGCDRITDFGSGDKVDLSDISVAYSLASGTATSAAGAGISFTSGFDAFGFIDSLTNASYLVYETTAQGAGATSPGTLEMIEMALVGGLDVNNGLFSLQPVP